MQIHWVASIDRVIHCTEKPACSSAPYLLSLLPQQNRRLAFREAPVWNRAELWKKRRTVVAMVPSDVGGEEEIGSCGLTGQGEL